MNYKYTYRTLAATFCIASAFTTLSAQTAAKDTTTNRTVVVEQEYNPDIMDASKVNELPKVSEPTVAKAGIEYATSVVSNNYFGDYQVISPFSNQSEQSKVSKGYARLGYGNYGNIDAKLHYLLDWTKRDQLGVSFALDGMDGKIPSSVNNEKWESYYYRTNSKLNYTHQFNKLKFDMTAVVGTDHFNYQPNPIWDLFENKQKQLNAEGQIALKSTDETLPVQFTVEGGYLFFSQKLNPVDDSKNNESRVRTFADVFGYINEEQRVGVRAEMNNMLYTLPAFTNFTALNLNPYYALVGDAWKLRIGAHIDLSFGKGKAVQVAPNIDIQYLFSNSYVLYLVADGGSKLNDFRRLNEVNPYHNPLLSIDDSFEQLNAKIGLKASPFSGFWFDLFGGYKLTKNDLCFEIRDVEATYNNLPFVNFFGEKTHDVYAGMQFKYKFRDFVSTSLKGVYHHWGDDNKYILLTKPVMEIGFKADFRVLKQLWLNLGYDYTSRDKVPTTNVNGTSYVQMKAINNLSLGGTYRFHKNFSAFVRINNLLNQNYQYYYSYQAEKINFLVGASCTF